VASESGEVPLAVALRVLGYASILHSKNGDEYTFIKGGTVVVHTLKDPLRRQMVHYLSRKFDIPIALFYNPGLLDK